MQSLHSFQAQNLDLELKFKSGQLEHEFGRPYQLGHHANSSRVEDADLVSFYVSPGDIIVMGSDGLLDNLSEHEIMLALNQLQAEGSGPSAMVQTLLKMAFESSLDKKKVTPYSQVMKRLSWWSKLVCSRVIWMCKIKGAFDVVRE